MSWQTRSIQLILGLPLALPIVSYAVNIGETYVQSGQNQPLNASINVTDIDPKTFSVKVATPEMYQQLGLSPDQKINVRFQPTSNNGGKIILTTKAPVSAPFTDVVLNIENKGEKNLLPKTLLMPLGNKPITTQKATKTVEVPPQKVTVTHNAPIDLPKTTAPVINVPVQPVPTVAQTTPSVNLQPAGRVTDGSLGMPNLSTTNTNTISKPATSATTPSTQKPIVKETAKSSIKNTPDTPATDTTTPTATTTYVVRRNDNLWTIANRIAAKNKTNPNKVMQDIMDANPNAFTDGDPTRIDANTTLAIPKYKVTPSQTGIKAAKKLRQQTKPTVKSGNTIKSSTPITKSKATRASQRPLTQRAIRVAKHKNTNVNRKSEMMIVAPTQSSGSSQGASQSQNNSVSKKVAPQLIEQVIQKRQNTAGQVSKVSQLNSSIQSSEQKLRLQNEKLAMLEKRLKELNK